MTSFKKPVHTKILYEFSLNIEPPRKYVHLRCTNGFRWKLPAEPERLLPLTCASFDALENIISFLAAWETKTRPIDKAQQLQSAVNEAQIASKKVALPVGETKDTLHTSQVPSQCLLFPRWIDRDWPIPAYGQTLAESFSALSYLIERARKTWPKNLPTILKHLNGFWEQLERAEKAGLVSPSGWSIYSNPFFNESPQCPSKATEKYMKHFEASTVVSIEDITPSLACHDPDEQHALNELLATFLNHELPCLGGRNNLPFQGSDGSAA